MKKYVITPQIEKRLIQLGFKPSEENIEIIYQDYLLRKNIPSMIWLIEKNRFFLEKLSD